MLQACDRGGRGRARGALLQRLAQQLVQRTGQSTTSRRSATPPTTRSASAWCSATRPSGGSSTPTRSCRGCSRSSRSGTTSTSTSRARWSPAAATASPRCRGGGCWRSSRTAAASSASPWIPTEAPDVDELARTHDLVVACDGLDWGPGEVRRHLPADRRGPRLQVHLARHRQGLRRVQVLRRADPARRDADPRLSLRRHGQHVHRRDDVRRLERRVSASTPTAPGRRGSRTRSRSTGSASSSPTCWRATR